MYLTVYFAINFIANIYANYIQNNKDCIYVFSLFIYLLLKYLRKF